MTGINVTPVLCSMVPTVVIVVLSCVGIDGMLISLHKSVLRSSPYTWSPGFGSGIGAYAVDGIKTRDAGTCSCCALANHTYHPWYRLDLGKEFIISGFEILGQLRPGNGTYNNIGNVSITLADDKMARVFNEHIPNEVIYEYNNSITPPIQARFIILQKPWAKGYFVLCEVSVFGDCVDGELFGDDCNSQCHCKNTTEPCDKTIGTCPQGGCVIGYDGPSCDKECPDGQFGLQCTGRCFCEEGPCNKETGECQGDCLPGYKGIACDEPCAYGYYGQYCASVCGKCTGGLPCNHIDGTCIGCEPGYLTDYCNVACAHGLYGQDCAQTCGNCNSNITCNIQDGTCLKGCDQGYTGTLCKQDCSNGTFGFNCNKRCGMCYQSEICNRKSGACSNGCDVGYKTENCDKACDGEQFGRDCTKECGKCSGGDTCHHVTGYCTSGCAPGYLYRLYCSNGTFGFNCNKRCGMCYQSEICNRKSGACSNGCDVGYKTENCDKECDPGYFGNDCVMNCSGHCVNGSACNITNGRCDLGCENGYKGPMCKAFCDFGYFGLNCSSRCGQCSNGETCNVFSGVCTVCRPGYLTEFCNKTCNPGFYGHNCWRSCSHCKNESVCDFVNGVCSYGCKDMYTGPKCAINASMIEKEEPSEASSWLIPVVTAIISSVVTATIIMIALLFALKRRNSAMGNEEPAAIPSSNYEDLHANRDATLYDSLGNAQITETRT